MTIILGYKTTLSRLITKHLLANETRRTRTVFLAMRVCLLREICYDAAANRSLL